MKNSVLNSDNDSSFALGRERISFQERQAIILYQHKLLKEQYFDNVLT